MGTPVDVPTLIFCVQASESMGLGHVMRCLAIAQAADSQGIKSIFLLEDDAFHLVHSAVAERADWVGKLASIGTNPSRWCERLQFFLSTEHVHAVILDGLCVPSVLLAVVEQSNARVVLLDDGEMHIPIAADIIVNAAGDALSDEYRYRYPNAQLCLGTSYRLMRREFSNRVGVPLSARQGLVVNFGGSDPSDLTMSVLLALVERKFHDKVVLVTGAAYGKLEDIRFFLEREKNSIDVQHFHNAHEMAPLWSCARLAISAAGSSQFELAACSTPAILIVVAENQRVAAKEAEASGWCVVFDMLDHDKSDIQSIRKITELACTLYEDSASLQDMMTVAPSYVGCDGASRLMEVLQHGTGSRWKK